MAFGSYDDLITQITTNGQINRTGFTKVGTTSVLTGGWHSCWSAIGIPASGAVPNPTPGTVYNNSTTSTGATAGGVCYGNVTPATRHLLTFGACATQSMVLRVYDRLVGVGAISTASTGSKTLNTAALPRYQSGNNVELWYECTTAHTTTIASGHLLSYTNQAGTTGQVGGPISFLSATLAVGDMVGPFPMAAGDTGIRAVSTVNIDTACTAGVGNFVLLKPLCDLPIAATTAWTEKDMIMQLDALPRIYDGHCLALMYMGTVVTAPQIWGTIRTAYK